MLGFHPVDKPRHKRGTPKRAARGRFSPKTIKEIGERDEWRCVACGSPYIESVPHHIIFKSQLGKGTTENGVTVCRPCHDWSHGKRKGPNSEPEKEGRKWFEAYQLKLLGVQEDATS